jgi:hypothetical protein
MTTTDYLINGLFVLIVLRQARERTLDTRRLVLPLVLVLCVGQQYLHVFPTAGNDLVLVALLAAIGLTSGIVAGRATHVRLGDEGQPLARIGWLAGTLLVAGVGARMGFAFAVSHGAEPTIRAFSTTHHIDAQAWPAALVSMAIVEVTARVLIVHLRGRRMTKTSADGPQRVMVPVR